MHDLLASAHQPRANLAARVRAQAQALANLRRRGFVGSEPLALQDEDSAFASVDFGEHFTAENQMLITNTMGAVTTVDVGEHSVVLRKTAGIVSEPADAGEILYRNAAGTLHFTSALNFAIDAFLSANIAFLASVFPTATGAGTYTIGTHRTAWLAQNPGGAFDATLELPSPDAGRWIFIADPRGNLDGTHRFEVVGAGGDTINGASKFPSGLGIWVNTPYTVLLLIYGGSSKWICKTL